MTPLLPFDDPAPRLGSSGAGLNNPNTHPDSNLVRVRLTPPARYNAPPGTSGEAARMIATHAATQRAAILALFVKAGTFGATDAEIELATDLRAQSVSPRRGELRTLGLIVDSGQRRPTPRGRPATVWVVTTLGMAQTAATGDAEAAGGASGREGA